MSTQDMIIILGGVEMPKFTDLKRLLDPNETDIETLGGNLFTDFINNRRSWRLSWKLLKEEDYTTIQNLFLEQYEIGVYHPLQIDAYNLYTPVKMEISDHDIKHNGGFVEGFSVLLKEQVGFS